MGRCSSLTGQTGQSDDTHSPEAWTNVVVSRIRPVFGIDRGRPGRYDLALAQALADKT